MDLGHVAAVQPGAQILGHHIEVHQGIVRGVPVIAQIQGENLVVRGQIAGQRLPVAGAAQKTMQDDKGRVSLASKIAVMQLD